MFLICSCFRFQCPTPPALLFSFTHQSKSCWKDLLCPSSRVLLEHPAHHGHSLFAWLLCALGQLWAVPSVPGPFTVPVHISQQLHQRSKGEQGKENYLEEACSLLFFPFPPPPLWEAVEKKISHWLICHPGVKQLSIFQNTNGENHPSCSCLQGKSALFVPGMLKH